MLLNRSLAYIRQYWSFVFLGSIILIRNFKGLEWKK